MSSTKNPGRFAGVLYVLTSMVGFFAMGYVPGKLIVHGNAAATANNIAASETLFRLGIAGELMGQAGFIFVALALYDLLKGINRLWLFPLGLLVYRSRFLPRFLGVWLVFAGVAWVILSLTGLLLPQYQGKVDTYSQPAFFGEIAFMLWLVIKGARPPALDAAPSSSAAG